MQKATLGQGQEVLKLITNSGIAKPQLQEFIESGKLTLLLKEFIKEMEPTIVHFKVFVDYMKSFAEMVQKGRYSTVNKDITEEIFPIGKTGGSVIDIQLLHFNYYVLTETVYDEMRKRNLRPATFPELLAFGSFYSGIQRDYPIVAFHLSAKEYLESQESIVCHPVLRGDAKSRSLDLAWDSPTTTWDPKFRFLAVHNGE